MKLILQVALDLINLHRALDIARSALEGGADWIEAGTPLIKSEGMNAIRKLRDVFPDTTIVADLKTADTGAVETEMAAKAGANIVCILGMADDTTIQEAVRSSRRYGCKVMVDLLGAEDAIGRALEVERLGVDYLCIHVGIDEQMIGKTPLDILKEMVEKVSIPIAVAGGLNSETVVDMVNAGASIIIVGGAITKAKDVRKATENIKKAMLDRSKIKTTLFKKYSQGDIKKAFSMVSTPNISDAMHKYGAMHGIRPIKPGFHMVGRALTVQTIDGDWAKPVEAIDKAEPGWVIVIDAHSGRTAVWGELATWSAKIKGLAGVVIDGAVRDLDDLLEMDFPISSRYISSNAGEP
ncbi:MAG TPA: bifunctional hexulose-6-phosphate synthase/ribonuclease regulator, partial [Thermoplasmatales archaeon]|nr:bifunctional hexulose-6-phosphate synthase/ribonuclease regulator [Thermoplasmatales archaeon]